MILITLIISSLLVVLFNSSVSIYYYYLFAVYELIINQYDFSGFFKIHLYVVIFLFLQLICLYLLFCQAISEPSFSVAYANMAKRLFGVGSTSSSSLFFM